MGLDVIIGTLPEEGVWKGYELYPVLQDCLKRSGLPPYHPEQKIEPTTPGRAYSLRFLAEFIRQEAWPVSQISRITCSIYQMIVPIDFPERIPEFVENSPADYNLWVPTAKDLREETDEEMMKQHGWKKMIRFAPSYKA